MSDRQMRFILSGEDRSAAKTLTGTATTAEGATHRIGSAFSTLGAKIGGEFGGIVTKVGDGIQQLGEQGGKGLASKLMVGGAAVTALGGTMLSLGSKRKQDEQQLRAAVEASGHSYDDYEAKIAKAVSAQEKFGHTEGDTESALMKLTNATRDPSKALADMTVVADLAASKHESLAAAGSQVAAVYAGSGKILKQYGITLESSKKDAADLSSAQKAHAAALVGVSTAQKRLTDLTEIDNAKSKLSVGQQITLRKAQEAVSVAIKEHGANSAQARTAELNLADTQTRLTAGTKLSVAQQIALKTAQDQVAAAQKKLADSTAALTAAQKNNKTGTQAADAALGQLATKVQGQASAASDSFTGKIKAVTAEVTDFAAKVSQQFGPAVTIIGGAWTTAGTALNWYRGRQEAAATATAEAAAAQEASAARVQTAAASVTTAQAEVVAAEQAAADAANLSASEQAAAQDRVAAAHAAAAAAAADSDAAIAEADAAAGEASSLALGPIGLAVGGLVGVLGFATKGFGLFGGAAKHQVQPTQELTDAITRDNDALGENTRKIVENKLEKEGLYDVGVKLGVSQKTLTDAVMGNKNAINAVARAQLGANAEDLSAIAHNKTLTKAQQDHLSAAVKLQRGIGDLTTTLAVNKHAADNVAAADGKLAKAHAVAGSSAQADRDAMLGANSAADVLRGGLGSLGAALDRVGHKHPRPGVTLTGLGGALGGIEDLAYQLDRINGQTYIAHVSVTQSGSVVSGSGTRFNAGGTDYSPGGRTVVAEREAELIDLPRGSAVTPLSRVRGGSSGGDLHYYDIKVSVPVGANTHDTGRAIVGALEQYAAAGGKMRIAGAVN